jgi:DNA-binding response OmpR family regulator
MTRLVVLDDDTDFTDAAATVLREAGYEVDVLNEVEGALDHLEKNPPDVLVLDVMFPENSSAGFDLARAIRGREKIARLPILILSAINARFPLGFGPQDLDDEWLPVQDFLEKPVDFDALLERVARLAGVQA